MSILVHSYKALPSMFLVFKCSLNVEDLKVIATPYKKKKNRENKYSCLCTCVHVTILALFHADYMVFYIF